MRVVRLADYARNISNLIASTNDTGSKMGKHFTPLKKAISNQNFESIDLKSTKNEFQNGTDVYKKNLKHLQTMRVPARVLGKHKMMIDDYQKYVSACQQMVDSINLDDSKVDQKLFNQSEKDQDRSIVDFVKYAQKIMMG
ncbi:hypothetical protein WR164_11700 [Philodulcilactobacillus myokoensis]|uniref:Uncharacterized protein n=1 Tax=Philodulcilactobacillus myokoensis TaxID=2929573 RepID=A0A9W6B264_9LACO|nr:hypothetical protein [Philodulcilactobacillus myokoensis]GLB47191.1 hypothetical protein WR164_11700 [Philodulcilactobacillus myokoensis]